MIQYETIKKAMGVDIAVSRKMANAIYKWTKMYVNQSPWLNDSVRGLNLPAAIASEMSRLVTMESKISITGSQRAEFIRNSMDPFIADLHKYVEYACGTGGVVFKPYISNYGIEIDIVKAGDFYPVNFDGSGNITAVIFPEFKQIGKKLYTRLEYQELEGEKYKIVNKAFVSRKAIVRTDDIVNLGQEISLKEIPEWEEIEPYVEFKNADCTLFSYFKIPLANNIDMDSPLGVSIFARAIEQIKDADEQYGATLWEYQAKETAIQAADEFFRKDRESHVILPKGKERLYHPMGPSVMSKEGSPFFNAYSPEIRDESFFNGYDKIVKKVEFNCGLAYGTLSDPQNVDKTAEEIKASKQRSYDTVKSIQNSLERSLQRLVKAIDAWLTIDGSMSGGSVETSYSWDDSLVVDKATERNRMKWYGETEAVARQRVADVAEVIE